eukprot:895411_1
MIDNGAISSEGKKNDGAVLKSENVRNLVERDDGDTARARRARINEMALACKGGPVGVPYGEVQAVAPVGRRIKLFGREIPTWLVWVLITLAVAGSVILYLKFGGPTEPTCETPGVPSGDVLDDLNLIYTPETCDFECKAHHEYFKNGNFTEADLAQDDFALEVATRQTRPLKKCDVTKKPMTTADGSKAMYVGQLDAGGKPDGDGIWTYSDGSTLVGQWKNSDMSGIGK